MRIQAALHSSLGGQADLIRIATHQILFGFAHLAFIVGVAFSPVVGQAGELRTQIVIEFGLPFLGYVSAVEGLVLRGMGSKLLFRLTNPLGVLGVCHQPCLLVLMIDG